MRPSEGFRNRVVICQPLGLFGTFLFVKPITLVRLFDGEAVVIDIFSVARFFWVAGD